MSKSNYLQKYVAKRVKFHRQSKGLSQEKLSEQAGLGLKYVNQIENQHHNISIQTLEKVIEALDMTLEEFFDFESLEEGEQPARNLALSRLTMKIKQLPQGQQETFLAIFEEIIDNIE